MNISKDRSVYLTEGTLLRIQQNTIDKAYVQSNRRIQYNLLTDCSFVVVIYKRTFHFSLPIPSRPDIIHIWLHTTYRFPKIKIGYEKEISDHG